MKQIFFVFGMLLTTSLFGQGVWFDCGIKMMYGGTGLINSAVADHPDWNYDIATGLGYGGKVGINFEDHGFTLDAIFGKATSSFETGGGATNLETTWKYTDLYLLYRLSRYRGYLELGPKMSLYKDVENKSTNVVDVDPVTDFYNPNGFSGVLGFGTYLLGNDGRFSGIFGLRFEYGFSDIIDQSKGEAAGLPLNDSSLYDNGYQKTVPLFAGLVFEFNWGIGYYGKASCGQRGKFIFL